MRLILKVTFFIIALILCWSFVKWLSPEPAIVKRFGEEAEKWDDASVVFVGSSRIRSSVNTNTLNQESQFFKFFNLGISGTSMMSHYVMSKYLLEHADVNTIVVEMALVLPDFPGAAENLMTHVQEPVLTSVWNVSNSDPIFDLRFFVSSYNSWLFSRLSLYDEMKMLVKPSNRNKMGRMGYNEYSRKGQNFRNTFITWSELQSGLEWEGQIKHRRKYHYLMRELIKKAEENNKRIIFLLPSNYRKPIEKSTLIWWYHEIPPENRFPIDEEMVRVMNGANLQTDDIHMSNEGSRLYTEQIWRLWELLEAPLIN